MEAKLLMMRRPGNPLSKFEQNVLLPIFIDALKNKKGKENAITANEIVNNLRLNKLTATKHTVYKIIAYIKLNNLIEGLVTSRRGYFVAVTKFDLIEYEASLISREMSYRLMRQTIAKQRNSMFNKATYKPKPLF